MRCLPKQRLSGASLIEVLIATLVVGLVLTSIAFLMSLNVKSSNEAELRTQGTVFAQQGVDLVRNYRTNNTWTAFVTNAVTTCGNASGLSFANTTYRRSCTLAATCGTGCQRLTVFVCWPRPAGSGICDTSSQNKVMVIQDFYNR